MATGFDFIVMPVLQAPTLDAVIATLSRERIRPLIAQIASAAQYLESLDIYHRDIKPPNIAVVGENHERAILLDLGVMLPLGVADLTDSTDTRPFVGTTRYSPPEFVLRDEEHTSEGYRAVTFYQLGAVLHDMLMRRMLFADRSTPFGRLHRAIFTEDPIIDCDDVPPDLVELARACLLKDPSKRLKLVTWDSFQQREPKKLTIEELRAKATLLRASVNSSAPASHSVPASADALRAVTKQLREEMRQFCVSDRTFFPPCTVLDAPGRDDGSFVLHFPIAPKHSLSKKLRLYVSVAMFSNCPTLWTVSAAAGLSLIDMKDRAVDVPLEVISEGVSESVAATRCRHVLYDAVVAAMASCVRDDQLPDNEDTLWLIVERGEE